MPGTTSPTDTTRSTGPGGTTHPSGPSPNDTKRYTGSNNIAGEQHPSGTRGAIGNPTGQDPTPWEELVISALLGTDRRRPPGHLMATGQEAPTALLDAAALHTVRRRAGLLPAAAACCPELAPPDPRKQLPEAAGRRLIQLLADRAASSPSSGGRRGSAPDFTELLPQWLAAANKHGYRAPATVLPALLDTARARTDLRPQAMTFAGPRGLWLARLNPDWKFALRGASGSSLLPDPQDTQAVRRLWEEGLFAERVALLSAMREERGQDALALLTSTWPTERAEDRLLFLNSLRTGLTSADEPFLEQALSDRSRNVRSTAAELLSALPGSALAQRMAARASSCVSLDRTGGRAAVSVEAPHECDAAMQRDGVTPAPPAGRGERSWWLGQLVEAAALSVWSARLGGRTPEEIVALPVLDDWADELHAAWCRAAVRQGDAQWSKALLDTPTASPATGPGASSLAERARLLATLPAGERADWVAAFIAAHGLSEAFQLLAVCSVPWSVPLGCSVVDALDIARDAGSYPWSFSGVMGLAERCLAPSEADRLEALTATQDEPEGASPGAGGYWAEAFQRLVSTLRLRAAMLAELTPSPAVTP